MDAERHAGRRAIVTGAASGIGYATTARLVREGAPQHLPRWHEIEAAGRVHPTAFAAVRAYRATHPSGGEARDRDAD